jgi:hypothetical protein
MKHLIASANNLSFNTEYSSLKDDEAKRKYASLNYQLHFDAIAAQLLEIKISSPVANDDISFDLYLFPYMGKHCILCRASILQGENVAIINAFNNPMLDDASFMVRYISLFPENINISGVWLEVKMEEPAIFVL